MTSTPRYPLGDDLSVSRVINGLWQIADLERDGREFDIDQAALAMSPYVDAGLTTFDMADHYGSAEDIAGIFGERAERLTKWTPRPGPITREDARGAVEKSLSRLRTGALDLLQFHAWNFADPSWLDALVHLQDLKREGLIRHLGVTNFDAAHLRIAVQTGIDLVSNQVSFSVLDSRAAGPLSDFCLAHNVRLLAYGTLLGGFLSGAWIGKEEPDWNHLETWSQMKYGRFIKAAGGWAALQQVLRRLDEVATKHAVPIATVATRWVLDHQAVAAVIVGARLSKSAHIEDTLRVFDLTLDEEDRKTLATGQKYLRPLSGDCGDEYRKPPYLTATGDLSHHFEEMPPPYPVRPGLNGRTLVLSDTPWEPLAGFSRGHRLDDRIWISGTTATHGERAIGGNDPKAQFHFIVDKIEGALLSLGATLNDVVRTRVFVRNVDDWEDVARAHGERFRHIMPANTLVQADLIGDEYLVEVEAEAVVV
ncbi:MAG: aldo/keto reductase, partial [Vicinamibacteria bacterium]|nr:aldo/keto reductase [Vicinamibacteria bacterium]